MAIGLFMSSLNLAEKLIEIQVRTLLQHQWAELSEKLSDVVDSAIKYGGGDVEVVSLLARTSDVMAKVERKEGAVQSVSTLNFLDGWPEHMPLPNDMVQQINEVRRQIKDAQDEVRLEKESVIKLISELGEIIPRKKGRKDAVSD